MFGMSDPEQTLLQIEGYVNDGRLEMSEVMATQFTDMFLSMKKRDSVAQLMLVRGLQILCDVLILRSKYTRAVASAKVLLKQREKLTGQFQVLGLEHNDLHRFAKASALAGKKRKAKSFFLKALKKSGGCLSTAIDAVTLIPEDRKLQSLFLAYVKNSGPVIKHEQAYCLIPEGLDAVDANQILALLSNELFQDNQDALAQYHKVASQINAIEQGEIAANIKLQEALHSLQPKHDYHEYS